MMGYGQFIFAVAVIDVAMFPELTVARCAIFCWKSLDQPTALWLPCLVRYFDQEIHFMAIHFAARHFTNPMST